MEIFLKPGDHFVGDAAYRVRTLLGSCVSIVLWAGRRHVGAMSHFMLPGCAPDGVRDGRYGADALALMLDGLHARGIATSELQAKVFGGGDMFGAAGPHGVKTGIGERNGVAAHALLAQLGIPVVAECLFGAGHRQVLFDIASGDVWARQVAMKAAA